MSIIKETQLAGIKATILEKLKEKDIEVKLAERSCDKWLLGHNMKEIGNISLTVSFDMTW